MRIERPRQQKTSAGEERRRWEEEQEKLREEKRLTRRSAVLAIGALGGSIMLGVAGDKMARRREAKEKAAELHDRVATEVETHGEQIHAETFDMGELAGSHVGGLECDLLGVHPGKLPKTLSIDYSANLKRMWQRKIDTWEPRLEKHHKHIDINVLEMQTERVGEYERHWRENAEGEGQSDARAEALGRTTLAKAAGEIDQMLETLKSNMDPQKVAAIYRLDPEQMQAVGILAVNIDSKRVNARGMLASYSMTELLPKWDGVANAKFYDFGLRTGGKELFANVPSLGDPDTSFGPLQFTAAALADYEDPVTGRRIRHGASVANQAVAPELRLPGSLDRLHDFVEHFKAGYLFAVNNIAVYAKSLHGEKLERFKGLDQETLLAFMSTSHNNPSLSRRALDLYLSYDKKGQVAPTFSLCCKAVDQEHAKELKKSGRRYNALVRIEDYADKTISNFRGLQEYLGS